MSKLKQRRLKKQQLNEAAGELAALRRSLDSAYSAFNNTTDPVMLEACILEIGSLQSRYGCMLKNIKIIYGE